MDEAGQGDLLEMVRSRVMVTQTASLRLLVVSADGDPTSTLSGLRGVRGVYGDAVPREALASLTAEEALFAEAWSLRRGRPPKERPGDGLGWDAEGFEPPDRPR